MISQSLPFATRLKLRKDQLDPARFAVPYKTTYSSYESVLKPPVKAYTIFDNIIGL